MVLLKGFRVFFLGRWNLVQPIHICWCTEGDCHQHVSQWWPGGPQNSEHESSSLLPFYTVCFHPRWLGEGWSQWSQWSDFSMWKGLLFQGWNYQRGPAISSRVPFLWFHVSSFFPSPTLYSALLFTGKVEAKQSKENGNSSYLLIYFWLRWVFLAVSGLSLVTLSGSYSLVTVLGLLTVASSPVARHGS